MEGSTGYIGGSLGFIVLLVLLFACCCCGNRNPSGPSQTTPCEAHHEARLNSARSRGQPVVERICTCPPGQGFNHTSPMNNPNIPPYPTTGQTGHEITMNAYGQNQSQNQYNRTEMGDPLSEAPPPYSPPAEGKGVQGVQEPEQAVVRGRGEGGDAVVWVEGSGNNAAPEVQRSRGWSRWAA